MNSCTTIEIKTMIESKIKTSLTAITNLSSSQSDEQASQTVLNLVRAYDILNEMKEE